MKIKFERKVLRTEEYIEVCELDVNIEDQTEVQKYWATKDEDGLLNYLWENHHHAEVEWDEWVDCYDEEAKDFTAIELGDDEVCQNI
jgi:hypothetical protein